MRFRPALSAEPEGSAWVGERGFITELIASVGSNLRQHQVYLCGPPAMIDAAIEELTRYGVARDQIFFDKFLDRSHLPGARSVA